MHHRHYDVLVIGSGGGTKISTPASHLGLKAAIIEKDRLGGTCLNRGCIPSKMLIHAAEVADHISTAAKYNLKPAGFEVDFQALVQRVSETIDGESDSILPAYRKNENLDYYHGEAVFTGERQVTVRGFTLTADKVYIATGSRPRIPDIPGLDKVPFLTSTEALRLEKQPKRLVVLGGGYIATELAFYYSALGTDVDLIVRSSMLRAEDGQVREAFTKAFQRHADIHLQANITKVAFENDTYTIEVTGRDGKVQTLESDALLIAAGVVPNSDRLNLKAAGVKTDASGYIVVDDHLRTSAPNTWALGDVVGNYMFRHSVNVEGEYLFETTVAHPEDRPIDYGAMPHAVFTTPQVAGVGLTEEEARAQGNDYVVGFRNYSASAMGMALRSTEGFVKLLVDRSDRKIIGCHIIGHEASVLIHQVITLMQMKGTLDDLLSTIFIHPALNEIVRNAARDARAKLAAE
ncbi:dihydrolipoyl dehydrogenase family protein [Acanthopleuribacter pedis]|uniref:Dihydrolipoyl dehydrogenase n=1 Tax=Acanthopleuribacter pedis TaxID=442870 RepID=A0A8J7Q9C4_9BACT|nr:dihydrolipoyl dehydrogenase [Acanthopleuribacter pedis]MBO1320112.1 dihydrolipoyl dehydrogenase [Acanthopleuribacter pedis]